MKNYIYYCFFSILFFASCSDEILIEDEVISNTETSSNHTKASPTISEYFDWENDTYIWYGGTQLMLPWASTNAEIPLDIKPDFKKSDGWKLLYNSFMLNESDPFFALYNVYTGLIRVYIYPTNQQYPNNTYTFGIGLATNSCSTSALNFSWAKALPIETKKTNPYLYKPGWCSTMTSTPYGIQNNYWYYNEFEIAYDPNLSSLNRDNIELQLRMLITEKSFTESTGTIAGTIEGTFTMPQSGASGGILSSMASSINFNSLDDFKINLPSKEVASKYLTDQVAKQANSTLKGLLNTGLSKIGSAIKTSNPILGLVTSGIFSPKSYTPGSINLDFEAKTKTTGTITSSYAGPSKASLIYPGVAIGSSTIGGLMPHYNKLIGVWNIDKTPIIRYGYTYYDAMEPMRHTEASLDLQSFNVLINPEVTNTENATVRVVSKDLILYDTGGLYEFGGTLINSSELNTYKSQWIGVKCGGSPRRTAGHINLPLKGKWAVRVTIAIKPEGNSDEIILIKEFAPNLVFDASI
ncbi:hypothetical protein GQR60_04485 [Labilibaculum sp. A4]|uniref:hypothetical protein n=1 Tax=Labilibaculum euxinus TaxID=2686357 RepID=UPI000F61C57C|nr:hypothetical protein [Labilibaculum euxinus]MDQ1772089.1 hypothetical protein [Labilibaculum euxinus]MWN75585.1 hypothetical protein [Labilibaculum euxinus]